MVDELSRDWCAAEALIRRGLGWGMTAGIVGLDALRLTCGTRRDGTRSSTRRGSKVCASFSSGFYWRWLCGLAFFCFYFYFLFLAISLSMDYNTSLSSPPTVPVPTAHAKSLLHLEFENPTLPIVESSQHGLRSCPR